MEADAPVKICALVLVPEQQRTAGTKAEQRFAGHNHNASNCASNSLWLSFVGRWQFKKEDQSSYYWQQICSSY
jgi:hypothetical protein